MFLNRNRVLADTIVREIWSYRGNEADGDRTNLVLEREDDEDGVGDDDDDDDDDFLSGCLF